MFKPEIVSRQKAQTLEARRKESRLEDFDPQTELESESSETKKSKLAERVESDFKKLQEKRMSFRIGSNRKPEILTYPVLFRNRQESLKQLQSKSEVALTDIDQIIALIPSLDISSLRQKIVAITERAKELETALPDEANKEKQLEELLSPGIDFEEIVAVIQKQIDLEARRYFAPLIDRARADIVMFLIKYANTGNVTPETAQGLIRMRTEMQLPVKFTYTIGLKSSIRHYGETDLKNLVQVHLDLLKGGKHSDRDILHVFIHEFIHNASSMEVGRESETLGVKKYGIFDDFEKNVALNELATELATLDIMKKYAGTTPGVLEIERGAQDLLGYSDFIDGWRRLENMYPAKTGKLKKLLNNGLFLDNAQELKKFFIDNPDMFEKIKEILH